MSELVLVTLPIGNIKDITLRALETLKSAKVVYAEDTRVFKELLTLFEISFADKSIDSFHDQTIGKIETIIKRIKNGEVVYLVSDAGSPVVSDPAYPLLRAALANQIAIRTVPGVSSVLCALELSALPPHPFHFWGFVARGMNEKTEFFSYLKSVSGTHLFFESPHRIYETIEIFFEVNPEKELVIARELTKMYETVYRLSKKNLENLKEVVLDKGEFVLLYHNEKIDHSMSNIELKSLVEDYLDHGGTPKKLAKIFSKILQVETKFVYDQLSNSGKR